MGCINHCKMLGLWHWVYVSQPHLLESHSELSPQLFTEGLKYPALTLASFRAFSWPIAEVVSAWVSTKTPSEMSTKTVIQWGYTLDLHGIYWWIPFGSQRWFAWKSPIYDASHKKPVIYGVVPGLPSLTPKVCWFSAIYSYFRDAPSSDPLVMTNSSLLKMVHLEIVDLPINSMVDLSSSLCGCLPDGNLLFLWLNIDIAIGYSWWGLTNQVLCGEGHLVWVWHGLAVWISKPHPTVIMSCHM